MNETNLGVIETVEQTGKLAFRVPAAAKLIGISERSLWTEIQRRKIYPTKTFRLISKEELLRYLREESQLSKRTKRFPAKKLSPTTSNN